MHCFVIVLLFSMSAIIFHAMESMEEIQENMEALALDEHKQEQSRVPALKELCMRKVIKTYDAYVKSDALKAVLEKIPVELSQAIYTLIAQLSQPVLRKDLVDLMDVRNNRAVTGRLRGIKLCSVEINRLWWEHINKFIVDACFSGDGQYVAARDFYNIYIVKIDDGSIIATVDSKLLNPDGRGLLFGHNNILFYVENYALKTYDLSKKRSDIMIRPNVYAVLAFFPASNKVFVKSLGCEFSCGFVDVIEKKYCNIGMPFCEYLYAVCSVSECEYAATVLKEKNQVLVYNIHKIEDKPIQLNHSVGVNIASLAFDDTGKYMVTGSNMNTHTIHVWNLEKPQAPIAQYALPDASLPIIRLWWHNGTIFCKDGRNAVHCIGIAGKQGCLVMHNS